MQFTRRNRTVSSALWSAYGDILGFPTELVDSSGVQRRLGHAKIERPRAWKRLVGGRTGVWVELAAGAYSDDTQLRLATSRAIRADGYFDVEAFAKVELPVWLSYCLGAGRGSKVGAAALSQRSVNWFTNFFEQRDVVYINGGGNGAAMRIQPHVWACQDLGNPASYLPEVIQNSICTHGHPRGIAGAVVHAVCLAHVLKNGDVPPPDDWGMLGSFISLATQYVEENADLTTFWLPTWNKRTGLHFAEEMERVREEWERDVQATEEILTISSPEAYQRIVESLGGFDSQHRGSGIKTALFSLAAAWVFKDFGTNYALVEVANLLGSDTDTIGTMTGALMGAMLPDYDLPGPVKDSAYIRREAERLVSVSEENCKESFSYPDLLSWQPPKSQLDAVGRLNDDFFIAGLGSAKSVSEEYRLPKSDSGWQWLELGFGQTVLCKRRLSPPELPATSRAGGYEIRSRSTFPKEARATNSPGSNDLIARQSRLLKPEDDKEVQSETLVVTRPPTQRMVSRETLDDITDRAIRSGFDERQIGADILALADLPDGIERAIAYASVLVKARKARLKRT